VVISSDHQGPLGEPLQFGRGVDAVLGVVELLGPDHPEPVLQVTERVAGSEDVHPGGEFHRPGQAFVEVQPGLVPLRDFQRFHPADREYGDMPLLAGHPVDELERRPVRCAVPLDLFGQGQQVAAFPVATGDRGQGGRRCHAQGHGAVEQPLHLLCGDPPAAHAERAQHLVELLDGASQLAALAFGHAPAEGAE